MIHDCPADTVPNITEVKVLVGDNLPMLEGGKIIITTARGVYTARLVCMRRKKIIAKVPVPHGH